MSAKRAGDSQDDFARSFRTDFSDPRHGRPGGYVNLGCRCERCRAAVAKLQRERRARRRSGADLVGASFQADLGDPRHGTFNGYDQLGCRCERCRAAAAEATRERNGRRRNGLDPTAAAFQADLGDPRHGTLNGYQHLYCRCEACRAAAAKERNDLRARRRNGLDPTAAAFQADLGDPRHGTLNGYQHLYCRCEGCRAARAASQGSSARSEDPGRPGEGPPG